MEVKNNEALKKEIRDRVGRYTKEFPVYFTGNLLINILLILAFLGTAVLIAAVFIADSHTDPSSGSDAMGNIFYYGLMFMGGISIVFRYYFQNFRRNLKVLRLMSDPNYYFGIEDHELDHAAHFIEMLPMKREDVDKLKVALSFGKIIDVMEAIGLIKIRKGICDIGIVFDCKVDEMMREKTYTKLDKKIAEHRHDRPKPKEKHSGYWEPETDEGSALSNDIYGK